jgi:hypothetical protein
MTGTLRNKRRIAFVVNKYCMAFARITHTRAINAHRENISNELIRLTNRARPVVAIRRPVKEVRYVMPVGDADVG